MVGTPVTPFSKIRRSPSSTPGGPRAREEKILVTVRVRPLSRRERALYDLIAWECPDDHTIIFKNLNHERSTTPYTFDKVFDAHCSTQEVYEEGAKNVALSALTGINATIFAYGQTSSGKTFTMRGIAEHAVKDIYEHIENAQEREFILKLSALEIYNESVVDLLNRESGPLRLLDDPEKGTIVEKQVEEVVKDSQHLRHLIGVCEAQRQVGETCLNDKSSRSHQIIRLTIESSLRESSGRVQSFLASLNLVDLAGSERASQTNADCTRLKEGSHINRSLLTLTTVIRKLSGGKRSFHIPYRDSKLTRILQHSLGGNARTAIICTMSPALSHVEQSRNTLSFATSAKEVTNSAQVNMVISDKRLVKQLQKEVARLEEKLRSPEPSPASSLKSLLVEKNLKIQQMEREMKELKRQRDLAQSQLELERKGHKEQKGLSQDGPSSNAVRCLTFPVGGQSIISKPTPEAQQRNAAGRQAMVRQSVTSTDPSMLVQEIRKLEQRQRQLGEEGHKEQKGLSQDGPSSNAVRCLTFPVGGQSIISKPTPEAQQRNAAGRQAMVRQSVTSTDPSMLVQEIRKLEQRQRQLGEEANRALEVLHKEVSSHKLGSQAAAETIAKMLSEIKDMQAVSSLPMEIEIGDKANLKEEITRLNSQESTIALLERKLENVQKSIDMLTSSFPSGEETPEVKSQLKKKKIFPFTLSNSSNMQNIIRSPCSLSSARGVVDNESENRAPEHSNALSSSNTLTSPFQATPLKSNKDGNYTSSRQGTPASGSNSINVKKIQRMFKNAHEENIRTIGAYITELKERVAKLQYQKQLLVCQVLELETNEAPTDETNNVDQSPMTWHFTFEDQRRQIIMLWHLCHVSIIHRTQFYLLFRGDPSDKIYMEVELRRLAWMEQHFAELGNASPALLGDEPAVSVASSIRALKQEREYLAKTVSSKLRADEIEMLYAKWEIPPVGKQRRLQLVNKLWTDPLDMENVRESAEIVAKIVGFCDSGEHVRKEMFELTFVNPSDKKTWMGWNLISNLLNL